MPTWWLIANTPRVVGIERQFVVASCEGQKGSDGHFSETLYREERVEWIGLGGQEADKAADGESCKVRKRVSTKQDTEDAVAGKSAAEKSVQYITKVAESMATGHA